jgi:predicted NBD/HSP70 family sugar kinase
MPPTVPRSRGDAAKHKVRVGHERLVLDVLRRKPTATLSQSELVRETGLSHATIATIVDSLDGSFLRVKRPRGTATAHSGRPRRVVSLKGEAGVALGIDLGQRHVRIAVSDLAHDRFEDVKVVPPPATTKPIEVADDPERSLEYAVQLAREQLADRGMAPDQVIGVCVGLPAPIDQREGGSIALASAMPGWAGLHVAEEVQSHLRWRADVFVENDANLVALAEREWGAARGARRALMLKWSTGIGAALLRDGDLDGGTFGLAGEVGHIPVPWHDGRGGLCPVCRMHCLQHVAGWATIAAEVGEPSASARELLDVARGPDGARVRGVIERAAERIGSVLGGVVTLLNPDRIVIGGQIDETTYDLVRRPLSRGLRLHTMQCHRLHVRLVPGTVPREAAARGAVLHVMNRALGGFLDRRLAEAVR